jgi:YesN/AraC family two-component response regulator
LPAVLVVEYDRRERAIIRRALDGIASLVETSDGEHALHVLARCGQSTLDLVLVDHALPEHSGLELLCFVRRQWPWIPVVLVTGFGSEELAVQALRAGVRDYLRKPIDAAQLRQAVATLTAVSTSGAHSSREHVVHAAGRAAEAPPAHRAIRRALAFADEHFSEAITLSEIAREASLSRFHFCRLFRLETGLRFREHVQHLRVQQARRLLANPRLTVTEVAYAVGFNDLSTFDKVFKKIVGAAPRVYRRACLAPTAIPDNTFAIPPKTRRRVIL